MAAVLTEEISEDKKEWLESIDYIRKIYGDEGVREILRSLQDHALDLNVSLDEATLNTPYINTIPVTEQPVYPGDIELEKRIENIVRWNAMAMVMRANDNEDGLGGHISSFSSSATLYDVGMNHFFRG
ncbi:MAG: pyruvate dehydrogenase (acetyl-transferring), homodimeric type, partial [Gammaproteobacteria bacterium]